MSRNGSATDEHVLDELIRRTLEEEMEGRDPPGWVWTAIQARVTATSQRRVIRLPGRLPGIAWLAQAAVVLGLILITLSVPASQSQRWLSVPSRPTRLFAPQPTPGGLNVAAEEGLLSRRVLFQDMRRFETARVRVQRRTAEWPQHLQRVKDVVLPDAGEGAGSRVAASTSGHSSGRNLRAASSVRVMSYLAQRPRDIPSRMEGAWAVQVDGQAGEAGYGEERSGLEAGEPTAQEGTTSRLRSLLR